MGLQAIGLPDPTHSPLEKLMMMTKAITMKMLMLIIGGRVSDGPSSCWWQHGLTTTPRSAPHQQKMRMRMQMATMMLMTKVYLASRKMHEVWLLVTQQVDENLQSFDHQMSNHHNCFQNFPHCQPHNLTSYEKMETLSSSKLLPSPRFSSQGKRS